jgi:hypothetical protein
MTKATEKLSSKLVDQVVSLIEQEFYSRANAVSREDVNTWQRKAMLKEEIKTKGNLPTLLAALDAADLAAVTARAQVSKELVKLLPKGVKFDSDDSIHKQIEQLANILDMENEVTVDTINKERRKYVARARMAKSKEQLEKILAEIGLS